MAAIYSNGGNRWNILGFNFTKRDALSSVYKISMGATLPRESAGETPNSKCALQNFVELRILKLKSNSTNTVCRGSGAMYSSYINLELVATTGKILDYYLHINKICLHFPWFHNSIAFLKVTSLKIKKILIVGEGEVVAETSVVEEDFIVVEHLPGRLKK